MKSEIQSSKKSNKIFLKILLLVLILFVLWFFVFNAMQIRKGRIIKTNDLISQEYQSTDETVYLYFLNEERIYLKTKIDEITNTFTYSYFINDGMISIANENEEIQKYIVLNNGNKIFDLTNKKTLYVLNNN